mmetsp:Transcript_10992/g.24601  ORF Transcript_10992/g.24601 Transcript_10992/m.24601 type:complete len:1321 (-) Transcript_10992:427-4389(-)
MSEQSFVSAAAAAAAWEDLNLCPCGSPETSIDTDHYPPPDALLAAAFHDFMTMRTRLLQSENNSTAGEDGGDASSEEEPADTETTQTWEIVYTCLTLFVMFVALISDKVGADMVMLVGLTLVMAARIVTVEEGISGFANEGLLTVMALFVVAAGISHTGALDWYMGKLLGRPRSPASAQLRLMVPISIVSAFLNNTPVVAVMIPIVQRWGRNIHISPRQLLIPLSFASILGGTCTLIGTSTNLVVVGLLQERYGSLAPTIGLFDLGQYGVPVAFAGLAYVLVAAPWLLPGGKRSKGSRGGGGGADGTLPADEGESILLGARLTKWSPAAGRTVQRSGLRDTGGIYLVSVHRAATGNVHRAVGPDFVLNAGDILFFTGEISTFGEFCAEHGLELVTNEVQNEENADNGSGAGIESGSADAGDGNGQKEMAGRAIPNRLAKLNPFKKTPCDDDNRAMEPACIEEEDERKRTVQFNSEDQIIEENSHYSNLSDADHQGQVELSPSDDHEAAPPVMEIDVSGYNIGVTKESNCYSGVREREREINRMTDMVRGIQPAPTDGDQASYRAATLAPGGPARIVIVVDTNDTHPVVVVGINTRDRPGLLLDISKGLLGLKIQLHHSEASVIESRSISIWRCEILEDGVSDKEEIWSVLNSLLQYEQGVEAIKTRGLKVIRAIVTSKSRLLGKTAEEASFRERYQAAIVAVQKGGKNVPSSLTEVKFDAGDVLVLQASDESPLLTPPPPDFYRHMDDEGRKASTAKKFLNRMSKRLSRNSLLSLDETADESRIVRSTVPNEESGDDFYIPSDDSEDDIEAAGSERANNAEANEEVWKDLQVIFRTDDKSSPDADSTSREYLAAMEIVPKSQLAKKTVSQSGIDKLPGVTLVSIERPISSADVSVTKRSITAHSDVVSSLASIVSAEESSVAETVVRFQPLTPDEPLQPGDIIWFAGSANAVGDLRKIPGMRSKESDEVNKIADKVHERRLVQAVIARKGPLVGKTARDVRFRTQYGAAVIAVHREGKRIHEAPGKVKLQAGDVLLLEAGPTFIAANANNTRAFTLLSEVEDSKPPRLRLLVPALLLAVAMLAVFMAGVASLLVCALVASIIMVCVGILTQQEVREAIDWEIYVTIACAFGIGTALTNSGVAGGIAVFLVNVGNALGIGVAGLFGAVYFATFLISNVVTNNAAAALIFPIAMDAAEQTGTDITLMSYCIMLGASASFMSPFGYTTNIMVYGPGGYKYKDFLIMGTPMQIVLWVLSVALLAQTAASSSPTWYIGWIATFVVLVVVAIASISSDLGGSLCKRLVTRKKKDNGGDDVASTASE